MAAKPTEEKVEEKDPKEEVEEKAPVEKAPEETEAVEEKDTPEETKEEEEKAEEKEEEFDVEEFKKSTIEETQKAVLEKMAAGLGLTKEEKEQVKDELTPPWEERGETKPKSWKEHAEYAADLAQWKRKKENEEITKIQEDNEKEAKEVNKRWNDYWDSELKELEEAEKIPAVKDADDENDPGKKARIKLFAKMQEIGLARQKENKPPITSVKLIFYEHYEDEEPGGANAPVSFGKRATGATKDDDDYSYDDVHGKSVDEIKRGG